MHSVRAAFFLCISLFSASFFYFFYQRQISINVLLISFFFFKSAFFACIVRNWKVFFCLNYIFSIDRNVKKQTTITIEDDSVRIAFFLCFLFNFCIIFFFSTPKFNQRFVYIFFFKLAFSYALFVI